MTADSDRATAAPATIAPASSFAAEPAAPNAAGPGAPSACARTASPGAGASDTTPDPDRVTMRPARTGAPSPARRAFDDVVWSGCHVNCGSRCPLRLFVKDGRVVGVEADHDGAPDFGPGLPASFRPCARGYAAAERIYSPLRVRHPLKRVAGTARGEGLYERIGWEQAISEIAQIMREVREEFGNGALYLNYGTGQIGGSVSKSWEPDKSVFARLLNCFGGYLRHYGDYSTAQLAVELPLVIGDAWANNEIMDWKHARTIVLFGNDPAVTRMPGAGAASLYAWVRRENPQAKVIVVDPRLSDTAVGLADEWVPLRPGTDAALVAGMLHHLLASGKLDEERIRSQVAGFFSEGFFADAEAAEPKSARWLGYDPTGTLAVTEDLSYEAYLRGTGGYAGTGEKTPEWASRITGVGATAIRELAERIAAGGAAIVQGWGPQRHSNGGDSCRAIALLAAATGSIGVRGGATGARESIGGVPSRMPDSIPNLGELNTVPYAIGFFTWQQAIADFTCMDDRTWGVRPIGERGRIGYAEAPGTVRVAAPIKFVINYASNVMVGQHGDNSESLRIYNLPDTATGGLRCVVTIDTCLTPSALASDYILPGTTNFEEYDLMQWQSGWSGLICCERPAIEPLYESKSAYDICTLLARELGFEERFTEGRTQLDWVRWLYERGREQGAPVPDTFEELLERGLIVYSDAHEPRRASASRVRTPSGRFEAFSKQAHNLARQWDLTGAGSIPADGLDAIAGIPMWRPSPEGFGDEKARERFPLQLVGHHAKGRTHSSYGDSTLLQQIDPHRCWVNPLDAAQAGVSDGDELLVSTARGTIRIRAFVTNRIMPGVVSLPEGAWFQPDLSAEAGAVARAKSEGEGKGEGEGEGEGEGRRFPEDIAASAGSAPAMSRAAEGAADGSAHLPGMPSGSPLRAGNVAARAPLPGGCADAPAPIDAGGSLATLTSGRPTPIAKGNGVHSSLCRIEAASASRPAGAQVAGASRAGRPAAAAAPRASHPAAAGASPAAERGEAARPDASPTPASPRLEGARP